MKYAKVQEHNDWEGETWNTYFEIADSTTANTVKSIAKLHPDLDYIGVVDIDESREQVMANIDGCCYMRPHMFMELNDNIDVGSLTRDDLCKGGIRKLGENLYKFVAVADDIADTQDGERGK